MGRSATIPLQFDPALTVMTAETETPVDWVGRTFRSPLTDSVSRLACDTVTVLVTALPPSIRYCILTEQSFTRSGLPSVKYSLNPAPTRPSAKYQVLRTGPGG